MKLKTLESLYILAKQNADDPRYIKVPVKKGHNILVLVLKDLYGAILRVLNSINDLIFYIFSEERIIYKLEKTKTTITTYRVGWRRKEFINSYSIPHETTEEKSA